MPNKHIERDKLVITRLILRNIRILISLVLFLLLAPQLSIYAGLAEDNCNNEMLDFLSYKVGDDKKMAPLEQLDEINELIGILSSGDKDIREFLIGKVKINISLGERTTSLDLSANDLLRLNLMISQRGLFPSFDAYHHRDLLDEKLKYRPRV